MFTIVMIGTPNSGRDNLIRRFCGRELADDKTGDFSSFTRMDERSDMSHVLKNDVKVQFLAPFWPGSNKTISVDRLEYWSQVESDKADGLMLVYSVMDREAFDTWIPLHFQWAEKSKRKKGRRVVVVATKAGEDNANRLVGAKEGKAFAASHHIPYFEVSARDNVNVQEAFQALLAPGQESKCTLS